MPSALRVGALSNSLFLLAIATVRTAPASEAEPRQRGCYLVQTAGCDDGHTPGYASAPDKVPQNAWLNPGNLRLRMQRCSEEQWLQLAHQVNFRPPCRRMPCAP